MRRTASEIIRSLEMRVARLESRLASKPRSQARSIPSMDAFDVDALIKARTKGISPSSAFSLSDVLHDDEINAILDHSDFEIIKKLSNRGSLQSDLINALEG